MPLPKRAAPTDRPVIVWCRHDLRLADNRALTAAVATGQPVLAVYVFDEDNAGIRPLGGASRWWLHHSLAALTADLAKLGTGLHIYRGAAGALLPKLARAADAAAVFWSRRYGAAERAVDTEVESALRDAGIAVESYNDHLLIEPWDIKTKSGEPFKVFTPFWLTARALGDPPAPISKPRKLHPGKSPAAPEPVPLDSLGLLPTSPDWAGGLRERWTPGEAGARTQLSQFIAKRLPGYAASRDRPDVSVTSGLSPHLRFGEIGPRQVWHAAARAAEDDTAPHGDVEKFLSELGWREFSYHLLFHNPDLATANFDDRFDAFPWVKDAKAMHAWQRGRTGYPIVDAGLRELWHTGVMHNRARIIVASFLIKHLLIDWRQGEEWFWDTLVDADPANNPASWQWVAGSGADAAPYFRIFNPVLQGTKFDPEGTYVRHWVPELARLPAKHVHQPWEAPAALLDAARIKLGRDYPHPIVALDEGRARALAAFDKIKR